MRRVEFLVGPAVHGGGDLARRETRRDDPPGGRERRRYLDADLDDVKQTVSPAA